MDGKTTAKYLSVLVSLLGKSLRKKVLNETRLYPTPVVYAFWHSNEFAMVIYNKNSKIVIMTSLSKDGEIMSNLLERFGYVTVRGSSSRGAQRALIGMIRYGKQGSSLAFAADGPRGPFHELKSGVIYAAQKTGMPVVPMIVGIKNRIILKKAWDKMRIPLPFSKTVHVFGDPIFVKPEDDIEEKRLKVEGELNRLFEFVDKYYWQKDIAKYLEFHPFPKILIVQPSRLGDIIFSLPVLAALKRKYPRAKISWIVDERCAEILEGNPLLENIFIWNRKEKSLKYYRGLTKKLRAQKFDLSIDLHGLAKSAVLVKLANAKFKLASSSTNGMRELSWIVSKQIKNPDAEAHCIQRHMAVADYLKCDNKIEYPIAILDKDIESVKEKLNVRNIDLTKIVGIHPGGGWISRRWGTLKFAQLIHKLRKELGAQIVLVGGKEGGSSEKGLNEEIISLVDENICDMTGKFSLKELCAFLKMCRVFVGNEAGPMHIATALNTQAVAILGPTDAKRTGPFNGNTQVLQKKVDCQPCRNRNCKDPICMQKISVDEVFDVVREKYENSHN